MQLSAILRQKRSACCCQNRESRDCKAESKNRQEGRSKGKKKKKKKRGKHKKIGTLAPSQRRKGKKGKEKTTAYTAYTSVYARAAPYKGKKHVRRL